MSGKEEQTPYQRFETAYRTFVLKYTAQTLKALEEEAGIRLGIALEDLPHIIVSPRPPEMAAKQGSPSTSAPPDDRASQLLSRIAEAANYVRDRAKYQNCLDLNGPMQVNAEEMREHLMALKQYHHGNALFSAARKPIITGIIDDFTREVNAIFELPSPGRALG